MASPEPLCNVSHIHRSEPQPVFNLNRVGQSPADIPVLAADFDHPTIGIAKENLMDLPVGDDVASIRNALFLKLFFHRIQVFHRERDMVISRVDGLMRVRGGQVLNEVELDSRYVQPEASERKGRTRDFPTAHHLDVKPVALLQSLGSSRNVVDCQQFKHSSS